MPQVRVNRLTHIAACACRAFSDILSLAHPFSAPKYRYFNIIVPRRAKAARIAKYVRLAKVEKKPGCGIGLAATKVFDPWEYGGNYAGRLRSCISPNSFNDKFKSMVNPSETLFKCTCTRVFTQANAYTKHQHSCTRGKKRLFSALSKAKDLLGAVKRSRLSANAVRQDARASTASSSTQFHRSNTPSLSSDQPFTAEPPPSVPSHIPRQPETGLPANSVPMRASSPVQAAPFRTSRNIFGLVHQFFSSAPPSHDPEEAITLQDISFIPTLTPEDPDTVAVPHDSSFDPYPNEASFKLGHWYWNGSVQKSQQSFKELIDIVGRPDYDPNDVRHTNWDKINSQLGASVGDEGEEWEDEDAGWQKTQLIQIFDLTLRQTSTIGLSCLSSGKSSQMLMTMNTFIMSHINYDGARLISHMK
ncbi:hypothetical protein EV424DRAFT_1346029 [Suillus variegatus]|nr:hypothetical protein EV424DRAFT_1346029 [Suillus variegatus]